MHLPVTPIIPLRDRHPEAGSFQSRKPADSKVLGLVLERISHAKGGLLPSANALQIAMDLRPAFDSAKMEYVRREKKKPRLRKIPLIRKVPIGLHPVDPEGQLNALMQLILFIPGLAELFFFAPRSLSPFQEFIDQYAQDQQDDRSVSSANGIALFRWINFKLPTVSMQGVFQFLIRLLGSKWEVHRNLEEGLKNGAPTDFFVAESPLKRQFFTEPDCFCYDLDAFVERRSDGAAVNFITYVKTEGSWYQCDDERITLLRSNCLSVPLHRAILLHYKRISFQQ